MNEFSLNFDSTEVIEAMSNHECIDIWGACEYGNNKRAVDYNLRIDNTTDETKNYSAFYKFIAGVSGIFHHDNFQERYKYEIDFNDKEWKTKLKQAAEKAYEEIFGIE